MNFTKWDEAWRFESFGAHECEMKSFWPKIEYESTYELVFWPVKVMCQHILKRLTKNRKINSTGRPIHRCVDISWSIFDKFKNSKLCVDLYDHVSMHYGQNLTKITCVTYEMIFDNSQWLIHDWWIKDYTYAIIWWFESN